MKIDVSDFREKKALFAFLVENNDRLTAMKKAAIKYADCMPFNNSINSIVDSNDKVYKANAKVSNPGDQLRILAAINTTRYRDNHDDVHIDGLWDKSLKENTLIMHLQEHEMKFDHIISDGDDLNAYTRFYDWKALGFNYEGQTQALVFDSLIKRSRNAFMLDQYAKGFVNNHSVGMKYVKLFLAINDDEYKEEFAMWNEYFDIIANKQETEDAGFFYAVKEANVIEGSAVPRGSNMATPTINNNVDGEPPNGTLNEPDDSTQKEFDGVKYMLDNLKF